MNFENKQFKLGRFCERICMMRNEYVDVSDWVQFINCNLKELDLKINKDVLLASIKLNYDKHLIARDGRTTYCLVGKWSNSIEGKIHIDLDNGNVGILYLSDNKIKLLTDIIHIVRILRILRGI